MLPTTFYLKYVLYRLMRAGYQLLNSERMQRWRENDPSEGELCELH
jgi:hypothetical protein